MKDAAQYFGTLLQRPVAPQQDFKTPDPKHFKGDPEDLDRFLHQLEDKFSLEPARFAEDITKIRYTGQRLEGKAYKWYRAYHLQISHRDAFRIRGVRELDPQYASWDRFESALRSSFGERITRMQAVREWDKLKHKDSVDDFVDEITRLMWLTGYEGQVVQDKVRQGLNSELAMEWAKVARKPRDLGEQLALLRDMGHAMEDVHRQNPKGHGSNGSKGNQTQGQQSQGKGKDKAKKGKSAAGSQKKSDKKPNTKPERKDKDEMLKGISKDLLDERFKDEVCQRCGKPNHRWYECWSKDPTTTRVTGDAKRANKETGKDGNGPKSKKPKTSAAKAEETPAVASSQRILEITERDGSEDEYAVWAL